MRGVRESLKKAICVMIPALGFTSACSKNQSADGNDQYATTVVNERYRVFVPARALGQTPLLVMIHGCDQNAADFEAGSQMNRYAEEFGFAVLYPDQLKGRNMANCWRWFDPSNRRPGSGEIGEIKMMIDEVIRDHDVDAHNVYVAGISSGAATAAALLACYPQDIQGAALHSGPALNSADNEFAAMAAMRFGPSSWLDFWATQTCQPERSQKRLVIIQGKKDMVVHPKHAEKLLQQFAGEAAKTHSFSMEISHAGDKSVGVTGVVTPSSQTYLLQVDRMRHAWAGGLKQKYFDPSAFSASELVARFVIRGEPVFKPLETHFAGAGSEDYREIPTYSTQLRR
jgi:poly(hydroxyalkanoate) depolymerase family esterase